MVATLIRASPVVLGSVFASGNEKWSSFRDVDVDPCKTATHPALFPILLNFVKDDRLCSRVVEFNRLSLELVRFICDG